MTEAERYNYRYHTIRGRFARTRDEMRDPYERNLLWLRWTLMVAVTALFIATDIYRGEMWRK